MNIVKDAARVVTRTADAATSAAGAVGGAAINGVVGGVRGAATGVRDGLNAGSQSTPAAALTVAAIGAAGLVEWPLLLAAGGTAILLRQLNQRAEATSPQAQSTEDQDRATQAASAPKTQARESAPTKRARKATKSPARKATKASARKSSASRRTAKR